MVIATFLPFRRRSARRGSPCPSSDAYAYLELVPFGIRLRSGISVLSIGTSLVDMNACRKEDHGERDDLTIYPVFQ